MLISEHDLGTFSQPTKTVHCKVVIMLRRGFSGIISAFMTWVLLRFYVPSLKSVLIPLNQPLQSRMWLFLYNSCDWLLHFVPKL